MQKPERLVGFIKYDEIEFPFEFNETSFSLMLYPPTIETWREYSSPKRIFGNISRELKTHQWIPNIELIGQSSNGYRVIFNVQDLTSNYNGFISFDVNWYMLYSPLMTTDKIDGIKIAGHDVNLFYPPQTVVDAEWELNEDGHFEKMSVNAKNATCESCGAYCINENITVKIEVGAYASLGVFSGRLDSTSYMRLIYSAPLEINAVIKTCYTLRSFFEYITYRKNVDIGDINLLFKNEKGLYEDGGVIVFANNYKKESLNSAKNRIIAFSILRDNTSKLFEAIDNNSIYLVHLCDSMEDMHHYFPNRIIMIFAAFEREYGNIYGQDSGRSPEYLNVKEDIISLIDEYINSKQGKMRQYAKELKNIIKKLDLGLKEKINKVLDDFEDIMSPFVSQKYDEAYQEIILGISSRMGQFRNGIAHCRLDFDFDAIHLEDIKIIEKTVYAMRFKNMLLSVSDCQLAIKKLFGENVALSNE